VDPRASLDDVEKRKFLIMLRLELVQPVASCYTDCAIGVVVPIIKIMRRKRVSPSL
jgi:hypothetical protein